MEQKDAYGKLKHLNNSQKVKTLLSKSKNMGSIPICSKRRLVKGVWCNGSMPLSKSVGLSSSLKGAANGKTAVKSR